MRTPAPAPPSRRPLAAAALALLVAATLPACTCGGPDDADEAFAPGVPTSDLLPLAPEGAEGEGLLTGVRHSPLPTVVHRGSPTAHDAAFPIDESLAGLPDTGDLIAIGRLAANAGHFTGAGRRAYIASPCDEPPCTQAVLATDLPDDLQASFLLATRVDGWHEFFAPDTLDLPALAAHLDAVREDRGLGRTPMPVLVVGTLDDLHGHLATPDAPTPDPLTPSDPLAEPESGPGEDQPEAPSGADEAASACAGPSLPLTATDAEARLLLFHVPDDIGTHSCPGQALIGHAILADGRAFAITAASIRPGTRIRVPQVEH